jgi:phosphate transport system substrate-binding protein
LALFGAAISSSGRGAIRPTRPFRPWGGAAPLYDELGARFKDNTGTTVNYQSVGSGAGVAQFIANTVDFGATDVALKDDEVKSAQAKGDPLNIPTAFGAVTVSYNLQGVDKGMKLDGPTIADIYLGKIKKWNDPAITKLNPGVSRGLSQLRRAMPSRDTDSMSRCR